MKFKSKTALAEHVKQLVKDGYLVPDWLTTISDAPANSQRVKKVRIYQVNYNACLSKEADG